MGRELRMVPKGFQHPVDADGDYIPLLSGDYREHANEWCQQLRWWMNGDTARIEHFTECNAKNPIDSIGRYIEFAGPPPQQKHYMPLWLNAAADHFCMYETCSEGTPISPVFATKEDLARWLADNEASAFAGETATYDQWLATIRRGWSLAAVIHDGVIESGVAFHGRMEDVG